jgi:hypothetical protein
VPKQSFPEGPHAGAVIERWYRCGKLTCHCMAGNLHGPYHVLRWTFEGKRLQRYIPRAEVERVRQQCREYRIQQIDLRQGQRKYRTLMKQAREMFHKLPCP